MTTDEMILALVASGKFTLPERLGPPDYSIGRDGFCRYVEFGYVDHIPPQQAHDLCACHMYREAGEASMPTNSAAAIKAFYEAMKE